jgi:signal transduction histidine kinase
MEREEIQLLIVSSSIVLFTLLTSVFILVYYFQKKKNEFLLDKLELELIFQSELVKAKIEITEQTLSDVSRELHDNIGQILSVALLEINMMLEQKESFTKAQLIDTKKLILKSLDEIRGLTKLIKGDIKLESTFIEAVKDDLERIQKFSNINCSFQIEGEIISLNKEHETIIYRILQESISNILKHSHSEYISVHIKFFNHICTIEILDKGKGFDLTNTKKGSGLFNMKTRAKLIGAKLLINSTPEGTKITIKYPIQP